MAEMYSVEMSKANADKVNHLIDGFLKNLRLLGEHTLRITAKTLENYPEIIEEDERKCAEREREELKEYLKSKSAGTTPSKEQLTRLVEKGKEKVHKIRITEAEPEMESYLRLSHVLDRKGYSWDKFFDSEEEEPKKERMIRQSCDDQETRERLRHSTMSNFIKFSYPYWATIKAKDIDFLVNHLHTLFPNSEYTDKLEIIYGNNDQKKQYIEDKDLDFVWRVIHSMIKTSIKYMHYTGREGFEFTRNDEFGNPMVYKTIDVDVPRDVTEWDVDLAVRMG